MTVRSIRLFPDSVLSTPCHSVKDFGPSLESLIHDLHETMRASPGVGLAAPQIGVALRVSVIDVARVIKNKKIESSYSGPIALVNPTLVKGRGTQRPREGCLSVPDLLGNVERYQEVDVTYQNSNADYQKITVFGFEALAFQHEIDHLNGTLFLDRVSNLKTDIFRRKTPS